MVVLTEINIKTYKDKEGSISIGEATRWAQYYLGDRLEYVPEVYKNRLHELHDWLENHTGLIDELEAFNEEVRANGAKAREIEEGGREREEDDAYLVRPWNLVNYRFQSSR